MLVVVFHVSGSALPNGGAVGVTTFFVLSGFLITSLLIHEREERGRIDLKAFYMRRLLRLYPALIVFLVTLPLIMLAVGDPNLDTYAWKAAVAGLYLTDFAQLAGLGMGVVTHTWSLAVEEQFYLIWPIVLLVFMSRARGHRKGTFKLVALAFLAALIWRLYAQMSFDTVRVFYGPDTNFFAMLGGAALGSAPLLPKLWPWIGRIGLVTLLVLAGSRPVLGVEQGIFGGIVVTSAALLTLIVVWSASQGSLPILDFLPARWLGGISYGLYLWHDALLKLRIDAAEFQGAERIIVAGVAVLFAWLSFRMVERPALRFKKSFERSTIV